MAYTYLKQRAERMSSLGFSTTHHKRPSSLSDSSKSYNVNNARNIINSYRRKTYTPQYQYSATTDDDNTLHHSNSVPFLHRSSSTPMLNTMHSPGGSGTSISRDYRSGSLVSENSVIEEMEPHHRDSIDEDSVEISATEEHQLVEPTVEIDVHETDSMSGDTEKGDPSGWVEEGINMLDRYRLKDAEALFLKTLKFIDEPTMEEEKLVVQALSGLAEAYQRLGNSLQDDEIRWQWMYIQAMTLMQRSIRQCLESMKQLLDNEDFIWFVEQKYSIDSRLTILENTFQKSLEDSVSRIFVEDKNRAIALIWQSIKNRGKREQPLMGIKWIDELQKYCYKRVEHPEKAVSMESIQSDRSSKSNRSARNSTSETSESVNMNDIHDSMTPSYVAVDEGPLNDPFFDMTVRERKTHWEHYDAPHSPTSPMSVRSDIWDLTPDKSHKDFEQFNEPEWTLNDKELGGDENEDYGYVITVYKAYSPSNIEPPSPDRKSFPMKAAYDNLSPMTEAVKFNSNKAVVPSKIPLPSTQIIDGDALPHLALSKERYYFTLAQSLCRLADNFFKAKKYKVANDVYERTVGLFKDFPRDEESYTLMANTLKTVGIIKCKTGDIIGGMHMMQQAIQIFHLLQSDESKVNLASSWYELGNTFIEEEWTQDTIVEHVMRQLNEAVENEESDEANRTTYDSDSDTECDEDQYVVGALEARTCYQNAVDTLKQMHIVNIEQRDVLARSLTRMGNCNAMAGDYDSALSNFEEALSLFKTTYGVDNLSENANIMTMMGVVCFLLRQYSKAATMYEAAIIILKNLQGVDEPKFDYAFNLGLQGIAYYAMRSYDKCVSSSFQAFETFSLIYHDKLMRQPPIKHWLICQSLYVLGHSYGKLDLYEKALYYLGLAKTMLGRIKAPSNVQVVQIIKALADNYSATEKYEEALQHYNEALEIVDRDTTHGPLRVLQNQLLNKVANVHVSMKNYSNAASFLEQALNTQKDVEADIKDDMCELLEQLGSVYMMTCEIDKAIDCFVDCLDQNQEINGVHSFEMASVCGNLATLYHIKACMAETDDIEGYVRLAETYYRDGMRLETNATVCVRYANFLYHQGLEGDAALTLEPVLHPRRTRSSIVMVEDVDMVLSGLEQVILPDMLEKEIEEHGEITIPASLYAKYLAVLCYKQLKLMSDAEAIVTAMIKDANEANTHIFYSVLGYALMEMGTFDAAAKNFDIAANMLDSMDAKLARENASMCLATHLYDTSSQGLQNVYEYAKRAQRKGTLPRIIVPTKYKTESERISPESGSNSQSFSSSIYSRDHYYSNGTDTYSQNRYPSNDNETFSRNRFTNDKSDTYSSRDTYSRDTFTNNGNESQLDNDNRVTDRNRNESFGSDRSSRSSIGDEPIAWSPRPSPSRSPAHTRFNYSYGGPYH
ncbi:unnamed protein product [Owenia fusiformis]|uniref:Uncharacterized protein n=1 Tax=Owenia fusiformis TaxID=6347 RepID=A0A8J1XU97_OWEFU|nr:unnamed protein product [Owenia fusiformis]